MLGTTRSTRLTNVRGEVVPPLVTESHRRLTQQPGYIG